MRERRQVSNDRVDELIVFLTPYVRSLLERAEADEFTTTQFIEVMHIAKDGVVTRIGKE